MSAKTNRAAAFCRHSFTEANDLLAMLGERFDSSIRFAAIEHALAARGKAPQDATLAEMDALWNEAKAAE